MCVLSCLNHAPLQLLLKLGRESKCGILPLVLGMDDLLATFASGPDDELPSLTEGDFDSDDNDLFATFAVAPAAEDDPMDDLSALPNEDVAANRPAARAPSLKRKRGRPTNAELRRRVGEAIAAAPERGLSPRSKARKAAATRWGKVREEGDARMAAAMQAGSLESQSQIVPYEGPGQWQLATARAGEETALVSLVSSNFKKAKDSAPERQLLKQVNGRGSLADLARTLEVSERTVKRKLRLLAFSVIMAKRARSVWNFRALDAFLEATAIADGSVFVRHHYFLKYKYDEMSIRMRVQAGGSRKSLETAIAKILQTTVTHSAIWRVGDSYFRWVDQLPTTLQTIDSCKAKVMRPALERHATIPEYAVAMFESKTRLPIKDNHVSNGVVDLSFYRDKPDEILLPFICWAHIFFRVVNFLRAIYPAETKGTLHGALTFNFAGVLALFKKAWKKYVKLNLRVYEYGDVGPGAEATAHNLAVHEQYSGCEGGREWREFPKASSLQKSMRRRRLLNGRFRRRNVIEHFCRGTGCCLGPDDTELQFYQMIDEDFEAPSPWSTSTWFGAEDSIDFFGFLLESHDQLTEVFAVGVMGQAPDPRQLAVEDHDGADHWDGIAAPAAALEEHDLEMPDPLSDSTFF